MAAISTLMLSDNALRREPYEEDRTPTTPRVATGTTPPMDAASEATRYTISNDTAHVGRSEHAQSSAANADPIRPQLHQSTSDARSAGSLSDTMDVDRMGNEDDSDNDTEQGDSASGSRKKKGQRFFCTGYPPCNLSFTRSEHLARHIRKHTGERPFQCHCNRRFSRLDNLRQHAQTVHVNEEIPTDSLAATGTRFQRQIRTDRVRPSGRPRTNTMSSTGSHSRGHSRNLSASSIGSTSSNFSTSTIDPRRRPPPLLMAGDGRPKLGLEAPSTPPTQFSSYATQSPNDVTTPTSATFSTADGSPNFGSSLGSPLTAGARGSFFGGRGPPARRLSVPSGSSPYQSAYTSPYTQSYGPQPGYSSSSVSTNPSALASPTASTFSYGSGFGMAASEDWRRRTWHPSTYATANFNYSRPATSGLTYSQTPDAPQPAFAQNATAAAGHAPRLPGIESFDHVQQRPSTPPRHNVPSKNVDDQKPPTLMPAAEIDGHHHHSRSVSDITGRNLYSDTNDRMTSERTATSWVQETIEQIQQIQDEATKRNTDVSRHAMAPPPTTVGLQQQIAQEALHLQSNNHQFKRHGWYQGPPAARTSPEDSSSSEGVPTPGTSNADVQPAIMHSNGVVEPQHAIVPIDGAHSSCFPHAHPFTSSYSDAAIRARSSQSHHRSASGAELNRLDALVAVATSGTNHSR